jgi:predicted ABC-type sugar transport system permease subunit
MLMASRFFYFIIAKNEKDEKVDLPLAVGVGLLMFLLSCMLIALLLLPFIFGEVMLYTN